MLHGIPNPTDTRTDTGNETHPEDGGYGAGWGRLLGRVRYMCPDFRLCPVFILGKSLDFQEKFQKSFIATLSQKDRSWPAFGPG